MVNTIDWLEIRTHDIESTAAFYENLFGWEITEKETADGFDVWLFDTGDEPRIQNLRRGGIWLRPDCEPVGILVYIVVDDIETILKKAVELGGKVIGGKMRLGAGYGAFIADREGNVVGLYQDPSVF